MGRMKDEYIDQHNLTEPKTLAERIEWARIDAGLSQEQLASMIGKARTSIVQYEADKVSPPLKVIEELAQALDVPPEYLAYGIDLGSAAGESDGRAVVPIVEQDNEGDLRASDAADLPLRLLRSDFDVPASAMFIRLGVGAPHFDLEKGDLLLVEEQSPLSPGDGKLYVFQTSAGVAVMRSEVELRLPMKGITLRDGNGNLHRPDEAPETLGRVAGAFLKK